jgi:hypothetical protein
MTHRGNFRRSNLEGGNINQRVLMPGSAYHWDHRTVPAFIGTGSSADAFADFIEPSASTLWGVLAF